MNVEKKKVAIFTINDDNNYGNRLQNYALQTVLMKLGVWAETVKNIKTDKNIRNNFNLKNFIAKILVKLKMLRFKQFNKKYINMSKYMVKNEIVPNNLSEKYDYFVVGSDQVWNYTYNRFSEIDLLNFAKDEKKISYAASFGVSNIEKEYKNIFKNNLMKFKAISVREEQAKKMIKEIIDKEVQVVLDPTLLLTKEEWIKVSHKPIAFKKNNYLLTYFLGEIPIDIKKIADKNNLKIVNLLKMKEISTFFAGPREFIYLMKNASIICTDSYHAVIFSIILEKPFIVYERNSRHKSMSSRLDTLLKIFKLENRKNTNIKEEEIFKYDYSNLDKILEKEIEKSKDFLRKSLDL